MNFKSKLEEHHFKKGKFISPFNNSLGDKLRLDSWLYERLPEYLWLALIIKHYGRNQGLNKIREVLQVLIENVPALTRPSWFEINALPCDLQGIIYLKMKDIIDVNVLYPLTLFTPTQENQASNILFRECLKTPEEITNTIVKVLNDAAFHQSHIATDMRYVVVMHMILSGKLHVLEKQIQELIKYPTLDHSCEEMRIIRPLIRSMEMAAKMSAPEPSSLQNSTDIQDKMSESFWDIISRCANCELYQIARDMEEIKEDDFHYIANLQEIFEYLSELLTSINPLDKKMHVLLGLSTYAYKRMFEVFSHNLFNAISGRSAFRCMTECYILMKYLLHIENEHKDIWEEYQYYGIGLTKLIVSRRRDVDKDLSNSHVDYKYLEMIVGEFINEEFLNMDTSYFDKKNIRIKAKEIGEEELYGLYYDYDSHFEHGLWGAVRESALIRCKSSAHLYHCLPDVYMSQILPSVWGDCKLIMNKILKLHENLYGIPQRLLTGVHYVENP